MTISEKGEARIRGYLYMLMSSLRSFLPPDVAKDAVREVESHIRERVEQIEGQCLASGELRTIRVHLEFTGHDRSDRRLAQEELPAPLVDQ